MSQYYTEADIKIGRGLVRDLARDLANVYADIGKHNYLLWHGPDPDAVPDLGENDTYLMHEKTVDTRHRHVLDFLSRAWDWARTADPDRAGNLVHLADYQDIRHRIERVLAPMARDRRRSDFQSLRAAADEVIAPLLADLVRAEAIIGPRWMEVFQATWAARNPTPNGSPGSDATGPASTTTESTTPPATSKPKPKPRPKGGRPRHPDGHDTEKEIYSLWMSGRHATYQVLAKELGYLSVGEVSRIIKRCKDRERRTGSPYRPDPR